MPGQINDKADNINNDTLFAIMAGLSIRQRAVLSLKYLERMEFRQIPYALETGYLKVFAYLLTAHIRLKLLLIINGCHSIPVKKAVAVFGKLTGTP